MNFSHDEYFIYTTNDSLERRFVHLTEDDLNEAKEYLELLKETEWDATFRKAVADNVFLTVSDKSVGNSVRLESKGYEGWMPVDDGNFELQVFFDSMIYYKCVASSKSEPYWSYAKVREWVNKEHRGIFENEFEEYLDRRDGEFNIDW